MGLLPLSFPPGFLKVDSDTAAGGRFLDGDKVRFINGKPEKWLGYNQQVDDAMLGLARGAVAWANQYGNVNASFGTHLKLYVVTGNDTLADITPIRSSVTINTNPFAVVSGDATVTVTDTSHGASIDDFVTFSGALAIPGNDAYTKILLHMDGSDAGTTFTDSNVGGSAHTWTAAANAQLDTAAQKFGTASGLFDGTGDWLTTADHADFTLGSGDWTIDCWFNRSGGDGTFRWLGGQGGGVAADRSAMIFLSNTNLLVGAACVGGSTFTVASTTTFTATGWHHAAFVRTGNILRLFVDGVQEGGDTAITGTVNDSTTVYGVGVEGSVGGVSWFGWIDEFRLSVGVARWTANFTPPTVAYGSETTEIVSGEYQITSVPDANTYTFEHSTTFGMTGSGGGAAVVADYQISVGYAETVVGTGWGASTWGSGTWGTPRTDGIILDLRYWSLQKYGNDLLASPSGGSIYLWEEATDDEAELLTNAPTACRAMFVTSEGYIFALGTTTPMTVQWPDLDDPTNWTPALNNTANIRGLQEGSKLIAGCALGDGINLVWTDVGLYLFQYTGDKFIYADRVIGGHCGLVAQGAFCRVASAAYWMTNRAFKVYTGGVQDVPRQEEIREFVFRDMDEGKIYKTWCIYDQKFHQVRWGYVSTSSSDGEPDKYVDVSLHDFSWTTGTLARTTGTLFRPADASLLMVDADGVIYVHNDGLDDDGAALEAYITFPEIALTGGSENMDIMAVIPDTQRQEGNLTWELSTRDRPNSTTDFDTQTLTIAEGTGLEDARVSGRLAYLTVRSNVLGGDFRLGTPQLEVQGAGQRR
jgi:hypothetical protein